MNGVLLLKTLDEVIISQTNIIRFSSSAHRLVHPTLVESTMPEGEGQENRYRLFEESQRGCRARGTVYLERDSTTGGKLRS
jgi:hypothetical protein